MTVSNNVDAALERLTHLFPKIIDLSLDRMHRLLADLGHPEQRMPPVIHVAGTNGKGSTVATMRAVLEASGYKVHVYTSPHLVRFNERIRLVGDLIDEALLLALLEKVEEVNAGRPITFFEVTTAVAFMAFARVPADVTLLEVGLGGRFDATNVVASPLVTVLASISMDHMQYLGDTLAAIAGEKAAIMKPGVPCVSVAQQPEALAVVEQYSRAVGAPLKLQDRDWRISNPREGSLSFEGEGVKWSAPTPSLPGRHQHDNAGLALAALEQTRLPIPAFAIKSGFRNIEWPARAQRLMEGPLARLLPVGWELWLDGGHNAGAGHVIAALADEQWSDAPLHLICGMLSTKAAVDYLRPLARRAASFTAVPIHNDMAYKPNDLATAAVAAGFAAPDAADSSERALRAIIANGKTRSRVLICGSLYLAGEVLKDNARA
ncbi:MAG: bifunctional folylpolyglutamate synthase/dihydrofolate synthase [Proteobacteria bacterium]|nr:bifunctional folylpolyglutamate synthase/dihydrofolate synthase [Pseudomonadota bacterium]